jgi:HlyD family secretion protein/adhesin transport system membrane fusion protein
MRAATTKDGRSATTPDWLTTPIEFEDQRGFHISRKVMRVIVVLAAGALVWATVTPIRELSTARGQLIPVSGVRPVQHLEGGIVDQILMQEGQVVDQGQPLMRLQAVMTEAELAAMRARAHSLRLQKERVDALLGARAPDFTPFQDAGPTLVADQQQVYQLRLDHRAKERRLLATRIAQRNADIATLEQDLVTQRKLVSIASEQLGMRQYLAIDGNASKRQVLESEALYEQAGGLVATTEGRLATTREALQEAEAALAEADAQAHKLWSEEQAKISSELVELQESVRKQADKVERLTVRAPARGRVQHVLQRSAGEVVRAGESIARIVPLDDALVAEVFVKPDDIAAIKIGNGAELKVTAYDFSKYGKIKGKVSAVSPTTVENEDKRSYYKVIVSFDPGRSDRYSNEWHLQPGMTLEAEIISGSKSLLQYLLKPIYRGIDAAFSER